MSCINAGAVPCDVSSYKMEENTPLKYFAEISNPFISLQTPEKFIVSFLKVQTCSNWPLKLLYLLAVL